MILLVALLVIAVMIIIILVLAYAEALDKVKDLEKSSGKIVEDIIGYNIQVSKLHQENKKLKSELNFKNNMLMEK